MTTVAIQILPHGEGLKLPEYETNNSAGMDLMAAVSEGEELTLAPGKRLLVPTGFAMALADGYEAQVRPRSGLAWKNGVTVLNTPGTIDSDYRGPLGVILINHGAAAFTVNHGDRIAHMVVAPVVQASFAVVKVLSETDRGASGFGSTGQT